MSGVLQPPCLDCRERRVGCHDPKTCQAWAEYTAQATALQEHTNRRRSKLELLCGYGKAVHQRIQRRKHHG